MSLPSVKLSSFTSILFLTGACLCINTVAFLLYCFGWIRHNRQSGKVMEGGWTFDFIFAFECLLNASSDVILIVAMGTDESSNHHGGPKFLAYAMKMFIAWNTVSIVICWCASCALAYLRKIEYDGQYSYFPKNGTVSANTTNVGNVSNSHSIPTFLVADAAYSLLAVLKIAILYGVYYIYLRRLPTMDDGPQLYVKTSMSSLAPYDAAHSPEKTPLHSWGQPTVSVFRPPAEWAAKPENLNPFPETGASGVRPVNLIAYSQPSYSLEQLGQTQVRDAQERKGPHNGEGPVSVTGHLAVAYPHDKGVKQVAQCSAAGVSSTMHGTALLN